MIIGCAKETMKGEGRVILEPNGAKTLVDLGAKLLVAQSAGVKSGYSDSAYEDAGAIVTSREEAWRRADLVVKVKQPSPEDFAYFRDGLMIACFFHTASNLPLLDALLKNKVTAIDYGTIQLEDGAAHILAAMSKVAGRIAFFDGAKLLMRHRGMMIGPNTTVTIIGLGNAGKQTAELVVKTNPKMLYLLDKNLAAFEPLRCFYEVCSPYDLWFVEYDNKSPSHQQQLAAILEKTDLLMGATHIPGEKQARLVPEWMIKNMPKGSVAMDISIDQGGCFETSHETSLRKPTFLKHGVVHYCVPNMPGAVSRDSTPALIQEAFPYIAELAQKGFERAVRENPALARGINTHNGWITHERLARSIGRMKCYKPLAAILR